MASPKLQSFAALLVMFLLFIHSLAQPYETDLCNFDSDEEYSAQKKQINSDAGCHYAGSCKTATDCTNACAALGQNLNTAKCVGNRCCCVESDEEFSFQKKEMNSDAGCHFGGSCETAVDCGHACAALGLNSKAGKCVGNRCCCI